jgi:hypothetical protein
VSNLRAAKYPQRFRVPPQFVERGANVVAPEDFVMQTASRWFQEVRQRPQSRGCAAGQIAIAAAQA